MKKLLFISALMFSFSGWADEDNITEVWITMSDGIQLAADIYWPAGADKNDRFPILLEYLPYRKDESRARSYSLYSYFLEHGYLVVRVDMRGTGNSEGMVIPYEYSDIELDDGEEVIDWLSQQGWSTGSVGMFGISWGGFNSIQMAMRNPPALKAFVALMATEYLYQEDVHYMDGIMHTDSWMMGNDLYNALPGAPDFKMDEEWLRNRFNVKPSVYKYMRQQRDGEFWDRASARGKYDLIKVPGYHIGGWYDGYRNSLPRMLENVQAPVKAMIGPWDHDFPHNAALQPQVEWRAEAVRWFDQWMKDIDTGILEEPDFVVYIRDYHPPDDSLERIPGFWRWEEGWPINRIETQTWYAQANHKLSSISGVNDEHTLENIPSIGLEGGGPTMWWGSIPSDQRPMDKNSLVYDSEVLVEPIEILGRPLAKLHVSANAKRANWVVRISDIAPDGQITQVAGAAFNGTHRNSSRDPEDIIPGEKFPLNIQLHFTSWIFNEGHKIRVAISNAMWPMLWPSPLPVKTLLEIGGANGAYIELPIMPSGKIKTPEFEQPSIGPKLKGYEVLDAGNVTGYAAINSIQHDPDTGEEFGIATNTGATQYPWGIERFEEEIEHRTSDKNPAYTSVVGRYKITEELKDRTLDFEQNVEFRSDPENFYLSFHRWVSINGELYKEKVWQEVIPRDFQ
ncbi:MAG TPA: CocE/NonD family hydrolase [Gammaproteobacteria bacterium]|nr:CocE/NonD family hydrolase [Gammaproteobacteria bacterium]